MKKTIRPAIFKWRQTEPELILCAGTFGTRFRSAMSKNCSANAAWRRTTRQSGAGWVQRYGPEMKERLRRHLKPTNKSSRVDETYVRVKGRWCYLYRAIDSTGATIDFVLSRLRDAATAKRLLGNALTDPSHRQPRVINTDQRTHLRLGDFRSEAGRNPATPLPPPADPILEQHPGAGSSSDQTTREGQAGLS